MFFTPILKSDWFYVHKTVQCLMVILLVAMLVMPILHQPQKVEAIDPVTVAIIGVTIAGAALVLNWWLNKPNPCPAGCGTKVKDPAKHTSPCGNCGVRVWDCLDTFPAVSENPTYPEHRAKCDACGHWYYICDDPDVHTEEGEDRYIHREIDSDCGIHKHRACSPEDNHNRTYAICLNNFPLCANIVYEEDNNDE